MAIGQHLSRTLQRHECRSASVGRLKLGLSFVVCLVFLNQSCESQDAALPELTQQHFQATVQPLLKTFCFKCHSGDTTAAEIDLGKFSTLADMRKQMKVWIKVRAMLDTGQMPPKDSPMPSEDERTTMRGWVKTFLLTEARKHAGDPGPVILRRLSNDEYNYTVRDLTGVTSLNPTKEFPVDGAAGEGFTNTGAGQAMSPSLVTKYLDAAKDIASHAVLLPDGIRFSPHTTRRDQTDEMLARIQAFYRDFTDHSGGSAVNLQGIKFDTNQGGRLPVARYLAATLEERDAIKRGTKTIAVVARERSLNAKYLLTLWQTLVPGPDKESRKPSFLIDAFGEKWLRAKPTDAAQLAAHIDAAQNVLWKFNSIGQFGREGGPTSWMEAVTPVTTRHELRLTLPAASPRSDTTIYLTASDLNDGHENDYVIWERPRLEFKADASGQVHPPIYLRDIRSLVQRIKATMAAELPRTALYLNAVAALRTSEETIEKAAKLRGLNPQLLERWAKLAGLGHRSKREITGHYTTKMPKAHGYDAINGWGSPATPSILVNSSKDAISFLTLTVPARGVTVHPSPTLESVVAWRSPLDMQGKVEGLVADADNKCGNGVAWRVELQSESGTSTLANGIFDNGRDGRFETKTTLSIRKGDIVSLTVNPRDASHACDTTHVQLKLTEIGGETRVWDLASDVVDRILESNPLPDSYGHVDTWHFCSRGNTPAKSKSMVIPGSSLANWKSAVLDKKPADVVNRLAKEVQRVLTPAADKLLSTANAKLAQQLFDWRGPLRWAVCSLSTPAEADMSLDNENQLGINPVQFGKHPNGSPLPAEHLCLQAPQILELRLPAALVAGSDFVTTGTLHAATSREGSVQLQVVSTKPQTAAMSVAVPILVGDSARPRVEAAMDEFRNLFPPALCYARIVPVDEVVTLTLFFREDDHLQRLMLDESESAALDRLWDDLFVISQEPLQLVVAFEQISEFATQDRPDLVKAFVPLKKPINDRAAAFRQRMRQTEPVQVAAVLDFADRAWRRTLTQAERDDIRSLYDHLRGAEVTHEAAIRLTLARILTSPGFLYRRESPGSGTQAVPVSNDELTTRLSYFLWSTMPDDELHTSARNGLGEDAELLKQTRRMLKDPRARRLAIQFACQWLHLRNFDQNDEKNEKLYPEFATLRGDMYEETVRFFEDMFRNDGSILELLDSDHTFLNAALAKHYGVSIDNAGSQDWRRVDGVRAIGRGGILGMATFLASQSGASRTSPILRGNWISETLLGEKLPRPPANVPQLPESIPAGLTARQLIEKHSSVAACAKCHARIDPYGFALEQYDVLGRLRTTIVDTRTTLLGGEKIDGVTGLRKYLSTERRDDVVRQFCRKLLGFALGREVQLSDEPLLDTMLLRLKQNDYRFHTAVESIVLSTQFRNIRGRLATEE
jgi:hypothetical protein